MASKYQNKVKRRESGREAPLHIQKIQEEQADRAWANRHAESRSAAISAGSGDPVFGTIEKRVGFFKGRDKTPRRLVNPTDPHDTKRLGKAGKASQIHKAGF